MAEIHFSVHYNTKWGESIWVVGEIQQLGFWEAHEALECAFLSRLLHSCSKNGLARRGPLVKNATIGISS
jgi:hypothetical protein